VGAVVALSGAVAALMIGGQLVIVDGHPVHVSRVPMALALLGEKPTRRVLGHAILMSVELTFHPWAAIHLRRVLGELYNST